MNKYDAVVIGLGNIGARFHHPLKEYPFNHSEALLQHRQIALLGGADPFLENRQAFTECYGLPAFMNLDEALALEPSLVSICTPSELHFEQAMKSLDAGVQMIWLEKPPVDSLENLNHLQRRAGECDALVLVNYQRRYCANYQAVRELFKSGRFGSPASAQIIYSRGLELNGSHMLDMLFFITNDKGNVHLGAVSAIDGVENPSFAFSTNGFPVNVSGICLPYHCIEISVYFERARVSVRYSGLRSLVDVVVENEYAPGFYRLSEGGNEVQLPPSDLACMFAVGAIDDLINSYEQGKEPLSSLGTAAQTQELIQQVRMALG